MSPRPAIPLAAVALSPAEARIATGGDVGNDVVLIGERPHETFINHPAVQARAPQPDKCSKPDDVPNRVCIEESSPYYWAEYPKLGVRSQGKERNDVVEFDVAGGWFRVFTTVNGRRRVERGRYITVRITRPFEVHWRSPR